MQAELKLKPLSLVCARMTAPVIDGKIKSNEWRDTTCFTKFTRTDGKLPASRTMLWVGHDDTCIFLAVRCHEKNTAALGCYRTPRNNKGGLGYGDRIEVSFDTAHNHVGVCKFVFGPFNQLEASQGKVTVGFRAGPDSRWILSNCRDTLANYCRSATYIEDGKCWAIEMAFPFESLGAKPPAPGSVWGFNVVRHTAWPVYRGPVDARSNKPVERTVLSVWPDHPEYHPATFADLVFGKDSIKLHELDLGVPHFGTNRSRVFFPGSCKREPMELACRVRSRKTGELVDLEKTVKLQAGKRDGMPADFAWTASHVDDTNVLELDVKRLKDGALAWRGSYDLGWEDGSLPIYYLHSGECEIPINPDPSDPLFFRKKVEFIAARQPRFHRSNTFRGAPSDFCLESDDGRISFNLMEKGVTRRIAGYIHDLYDTDADRLTGMMFFVAQPCMMRANMIYDPSALHRLDNLSKLRFGSGNCGHISSVLAAFVNQMNNSETGEFHRARAAMIGGHVVTLVEYRGDYVVFDSKHCCVFYKLDNTDLAGLSEIRAEPVIVKRTCQSWMMPALMTFDEKYVFANALDKFDANGCSYPSGAPTA